MAEPDDPMCPLAPDGDTPLAYDEYLQAIAQYNDWKKRYDPERTRILLGTVPYDNNTVFAPPQSDEANTASLADGLC